jgi:hypothetical protein
MVLVMAASDMTKTFEAHIKIVTLIATIAWPINHLLAEKLSTIKFSKRRVREWENTDTTT